MMLIMVGNGEEQHVPRTWTTRELAEEWNVTPGRIKQWISEERLKAYKRGGRLFIPRGQKRPRDLRPRKNP